VNARIITSIAANLCLITMFLLGGIVHKPEVVIALFIPEEGTMPQSKTL
jgi:hypothetical protein